MLDKNIIAASDILEKVLPQFFTWRLCISEQDESVVAWINVFLNKNFNNIFPFIITLIIGV